MEIIKSMWATKSETENPQFKEIIEKFNLFGFWSRIWEYPFAILNSELKPSLKVLDAGCIGSPLLSFLHNFGCEVYGIDILAHPSNDSIKIYKEDIKHTHFPDEFFDRIFCVSVLEHIRDDPMKSISELMRILKSSGLLIITLDVNHGNWGWQFKEKDFLEKICKPMDFLPGSKPPDILESEQTVQGRKAGPGLSVFGLVIQK